MVNDPNKLMQFCKLLSIEKGLSHHDQTRLRQVLPTVLLTTYLKFKNGSIGVDQLMKLTEIKSLRNLLEH